jgi:YaiO family outer membrane protein
VLAINLVRVLCLSLFVSTAAAETVAPATPTTADTSPLVSKERWTATALYSQSQLSGNRPDWHETSADLQYRASPDLFVGGSVVERKRATTDFVYAVRASHLPSKGLELHGEIAWSPSPDFSAQQAYSAGLEWQRGNQLSLLLDYKRLNFSFGDVDLYTPGATWWFDDKTYLTGRYSEGRAFGDTSFNYYSLMLNVGLRDNARVRLGFARGSDPERSPGSLSTLLTDADIYSAYLFWPVGHRNQLIVGTEYEDRTNIYRRNALTIGFSTRF